jgi:hypothetical protein
MKISENLAGYSDGIDRRSSAPRQAECRNLRSAVEADERCGRKRRDVYRARQAARGCNPSTRAPSEDSVRRRVVFGVVLTPDRVKAGRRCLSPRRQARGPLPCGSPLGFEPVLGAPSLLTLLPTVRLATWGRVPGSSRTGKDNPSEGRTPLGAREVLDSPIRRRPPRAL